MTPATIATAILARDATLTNRRIALSLTQTQLAEALGCSHDTIARAETRPGSAAAQRLAECLCALENGASVRWRDPERVTAGVFREVNEAVRWVGVPVIATRLGFTSTQAVYKLLKYPMTTKTAARLRAALEGAQ